MSTSRRMIYTGRVQGVGFRYSVKQIAAGFDVTGWVRNLPDGTVEMLAVGMVDEVEAFVDAVAASHLGGYIREARREEGDSGLPASRGFEVRH